MVTAGQTFENPVTGERMAFRTTARDTNGTLLEVEFFIQPHSGKGPGAHLHPYFDERFEILAGSARYIVGKDEHQATAGDAIILPRGIQHIHPWNVGEEVLHVRQVIRLDEPRLEWMLRIEAFLETLYALAQQGKVGQNGLPKNTLHMMVVVQALQPATYVAGPPIAMQRALFGMLAALGRASGYKAHYPAASVSVPVS